MLIVCPNCATSYDLEVASLRPNGRRVRCVRCRTVWHAELSQADRLIAAAEELAPVRRAVEALAAVAGEAADEPPMDHVGAMASLEGDPESGHFAAEEPHDGPALDMADEPNDAVDAFETNVVTETDSPPIAPVDLDADRPPIDVEADDVSDAHAVEDTPEDVESAAARRFGRPSLRKGLHWPLSHLQSAMLMLIIVDAIVVGWRTDFVRALPQTASFYSWIRMPVNLRGLNFDSLATVTEQHEGVPILVVQGDVVNDTGKSASVPHLRFAVRNAARQEIYSWTTAPSRTVLPPGEALAFRTRLASPPPDAHDVLVRFVNRYDVMMGTH
jgi:predicted Zn finger-like uncharacterized protein